MRTTIIGAAIAGLTAIVPAAHAGDFFELFLVDFEEFPESTPISNQYAEFGITFSLPGSKDFPIISTEGAPVTAFSPNDNVMSSGSGGLTDPVVGNDAGVPADVQMDFDPPVTSVRLFLIDVDASDVFTVTAFDADDNVVDSMTVAAGDPGTGNGASTEINLAGDIHRVLIDPPDGGTDIGWATDFITFTRPCEGICGKQIRVSQESAPGAGDFADNVLGFLGAYPSLGTTATEFYGYGIPEGSSWNGALLTPVADRSHFVFADTLEGLTLFVIHDRAIPNDPDGGDAELMYEFINDDDGGEITVRDDPNDGYSGEPGDLVFTSDHAWATCCTDGLALSGLDCEGILDVTFTDTGGGPTIDGLTEWVAYSSNGDQITLALEEERTVRFEVVPPPSCLADLNCTGTVNAADLAILLSAWGPNPGSIADIDGDDTVGPADLAALLSQWGVCQ